MPAHQVDLKIVLLGDNAVGKSSLALRFANNSFIPCLEATIGSAYISRRLEVGNRKLVLGVWDTAGSERYDAMTKLYYRGAQAAVVCYDATSPKSLKKVKYWIGELRSVEECCKIYICVTKKDLIAYSDPGTMKNLEDVENYANGVQSKFYTTSSKTGENVAQISIYAKIIMYFESIGKKISGLSDGLSGALIGDNLSPDYKKAIS